MSSVASFSRALAMRRISRLARWVQSMQTSSGSASPFKYCCKYAQGWRSACADSRSFCASEARVAEVLSDPRILAAAVKQPAKSSSAWERDAAKYGKELKKLVREEVQLIRDKDKHSKA